MSSGQGSRRCLAVRSIDQRHAQLPRARLPDFRRAVIRARDVAARTDPTTVIVARTAALAYGALDEAVDRMQAYAQTGVEVLRLVGLYTSPLKVHT